jgi:hypothetical protein
MSDGDGKGNNDRPGDRLKGPSVAPYMNTRLIAIGRAWTGFPGPREIRPGPPMKSLRDPIGPAPGAITTLAHQTWSKMPWSASRDSTQLECL